MDDDNEIKWIIGILLGLMIVIFGGIFGFEYLGNRWDCAGYETATGKPTKYIGNTCYIQDSGQWYAWQEYKNRFVANGVMK